MPVKTEALSMKQSFFILCIWLGGPGIAFAQSTAMTDDSGEEAAIRATGQLFIEAYDNGGGEAVANCWTEDGEYIYGQTTVKGRAAIAGLYNEFFRAHPGSQMEIKIDSIRVLAPTVALEQGTASVSSSPNGPPSSSAYTAVHVKQNGKWLMTSVRESEATPPTADQNLTDLGWLVGVWAAQDGAEKVEIKYDWMDNEKFLQSKTTIEHDGIATSGGMQIIGKNPLTGRLVSWFFNPDGGYGYGVWFKDGSRWMIQTEGATADGAPTSATNVLYHPDDNVTSWRSVNRTRADTALPDIHEIVIERVSTGN
jgi:uncharacterized protein (TIGR02246 family)